MKAMFDKQREFGLYTLKCHLFDHLVKSNERLGNLEIMHASMLERVNVHIKLAYRRRFQQQGSEMLEKIELMVAPREKWL